MEHAPCAGCLFSVQHMPAVVLAVLTAPGVDVEHALAAAHGLDLVLHMAQAACGGSD